MNTATTAVMEALTSANIAEIESKIQTFATNGIKVHGPWAKKIVSILLPDIDVRDDEIDWVELATWMKSSK